MSNSKTGTERWPTQPLFKIDVEELKRQQDERERSGDGGKGLIDKFREHFHITEQDSGSNEESE